VSVSSELLWRGVTGVSNAGKKKGRGKRVGRKKATDLNRGQRLGVGNRTFLFKTVIFLQVTEFYLEFTTLPNAIPGLLYVSLYRYSFSEFSIHVLHCNMI